MFFNEDDFFQYLFFQRLFLRENATVRVCTIKYQKKIFVQGFQNCPPIWKPSTGGRVMDRPVNQVRCFSMEDFFQYLFFKRIFLRQIATIQICTIKYQKKIFVRGFQNCPRTWNPSTGGRVMAHPVNPVILSLIRSHPVYQDPRKTPLKYKSCGLYNSYK